MVRRIASLAVAFAVAISLFSAIAIYQVAETTKELAFTRGDSAALGFTITIHKSESLAEFGHFNNATFVLRANGSAEFSSHSTSSQIPDESYSTDFSTSIAQNAYDTLVNEGIFSLNERQVDYPHSVSGKIVSTILDLEATQSAHLVFEGNSMAGIMPNSYVTLWNLAGATKRGATSPFNIDFNVNLSEPDPASGLVHVTMNLTNNEEQTVYAIGWPPLWMPIVVKDSGWTALDDPWWNITWLMVITTHAIEPQSTLSYGELTRGFWWDIRTLSNGTYTVMSMISLEDSEHGYSTGGSGIWTQYGCHIVTLGDGASFVDSTPSGFITLPALIGETGSALSFDSSASSDKEDGTSELQFRWDFDGDGTWDTDWISASVADHAYDEPGNYSVTLQVRDTSGLINEVSTWILITEDGKDNSLALVGGLAAIAVAVALAVFLVLRRKRPKASEPK